MSEEYTKRIQKLVKLHGNDDDLNHVIGTDKYCSYCEEYKKIKSKSKGKVKEEIYIMLEEEEPNTLEKKKSELYIIMLANEVEYLLYSNEKKLAKFLENEKSPIRKKIILAQKYWSSYYIETKFGIVMDLEQIMKENNKHRVIAKKIKNPVNKRSGYVSNSEPMKYFLYESKFLKRLETFIEPLEVVKTKKFESEGTVTINTATGNICLKNNQVLLKLPLDVIVIYSEEDFFNLFLTDENMIWQKA